LPNPASAHASTPGEIDAAFATLRQRRAGALLVGSGAFFPSRRQQIVTLAARDVIPGMYSILEYVDVPRAARHEHGSAGTRRTLPLTIRATIH
jgi:thiamine pyrophosphate-dependent acetolactate synthase large subunit-like protein